MAHHACLAGLDDRLVIVTSAYRFLLTTPRELLVAQDGRPGLPRLHGFSHGEVACALSPWDEVRNHPQLAVVSSRGIVYVVDTAQVRGRLERSILFTLETTNQTDPIAVVGLGREQRLALVTSTGRALRLETSAVPYLGLQAIKRNKNEQIVGCLALEECAHLLLVAADGVARRLTGTQLPLVAEANARVTRVAARLAVRCVLRHDDTARLWLLTSHLLRPVKPDAAGTAGQATKPLRVIALTPGEQVVAAVTAG